MDNEDEIVEKCRAGDIGAFKMIYQRYERPLLHTARRMLGRREDAEDAVQQTFINLYRAVHRFKSGARFSTWLFRIHLNVCYDALRKRRRAPTDQLEIDPADRAPACDPHLGTEIDRAIEALPRRMRACFVLYAVEGFEQKEVARILKISVGGVKSNVFHARERLRAALAPRLQEST